MLAGSYAMVTGANRGIGKAILEALAGNGANVIGGARAVGTLDEPCRKLREAYDPERTPSTVGLLTEYFRRQENTVRTIHPIFSVAIWGADREYFRSDLGKDCFGEDSIFGKLHRKGGKLLFLGAPFQSCTFVHYIEKRVRIPYRYLKTFEGTIKEGDRTYTDSYRFLVKYLNQNIETDLSRLEAHLLETGSMNKVPPGDGQVLCVNSENMMNEGRQLLSEDIYAFLKHPPKQEAT